MTTPSSHNKNGPIGVFDSGTGGLTVLIELMRELPNERFVFFGDTAHCPFGKRSAEEIKDFAAAAAEFFLSQGAKLIVLACNYASVVARETLRQRYPVPFVAVVPAVKPAAQATKSGHIGVMATDAVSRNPLFLELVEELRNGVQTTTIGCTRLVEHCEAGELDGPKVEATIHDYIDLLLAAGVDTLVLGCTHFPLLRAPIQRVAGPNVTVIDSGAAVARQARRVLEQDSMLRDVRAPLNGHKRLEVNCSGDPRDFAQVASMILGRRVAVRQALAPVSEAKV
ncbi:MAG TPA: glutamate racemase [Ktedonobacterales bacterium]|jgi:glutamate racemase